MLYALMKRTDRQAGRQADRQKTNVYLAELDQDEVTTRAFARRY